jgi:hypothetical protein
LSFAPAARVWRVVALAVTIAGAAAVAATYFTFSNTYDEPAHIAAGMQSLVAGRYDLDMRQPPLARLAAAIGPYLHHDRAIGASSSAYDEGARLLGRGEHYRTTLALARLGELPFFLLLCGVVWAWGRRLTDERGGAIAVFLLASNPNVLAHAGLATTDLALAAMTAAAVFAFVVWIDAPRWWLSLALGAAVGFVMTTDFSAVATLTLSFAGIYAVRRHATGNTRVGPEDDGWRSLLGLPTVVAAAAICGWAAYGFRVGPLYDGSWIMVPGSEWFRGLWSYVGAGETSRPAFLFGERSVGGWWYYYAIVLLVKTPLPLLLLSILGAAAAVRDLVRRETWQLIAAVVAGASIVVTAALSGDDLGVRLILPLFGLLAVLGAIAAVELWDQSARSVPARRLVRAAVAATLIAGAMVPLRTHPDYLAYFNPIAGDRPEMILVDSNLDWGQDLYRLGMVMKRMHIDSMSVAYYGSASFDAAGVHNVRPLAAAERPTGWIAASQTMLAGAAGDGAYEWLNELPPVGRVGSSLVLYYVPPKRRPRR